MDEIIAQDISSLQQSYMNKALMSRMKIILLV